VVKKVWVRTLADRRGIRLLSVNNVTIDELSPEQQAQLKDAVDQFQ
jgi:hypothetical protein